MKAVTLSEGFHIFFRALWRTKFYALDEAAEWMFRLNSFTREIKRHEIKDIIYELKDEFIRYLYQHGYATEVRKQYQNRPCRACGGSGEYWTGADCNRCDGSGVYDTTWLYAFRFTINGRRFAWHQLVKLVDYPIILTSSDEKLEPVPKLEQRPGVIKDLHEAWFGCCIVWWCLLAHGVFVDLDIFESARIFIRFKWRSIAQRVKLVKDDPALITDPDDDIPF